MLFGVRLRAAARGGVEVVISNPAGREGWFVLPWRAAEERFQPSLHDRALIAALGEEPPTPARLRETARKVAAQGLAGRAARRAAEGAVPAWPVRLARVQAFLQDLMRPRGFLATDADCHRSEVLRSQGLAALALANAQPAQTPLGAARRDWLLDGWELFAAAWAEASPVDRPALLRHAACLAPPLPQEVHGWPGGDMVDEAASPRGGGTVRPITQEIAEAALARWLTA
ncbi:MAG: hypothetical protein N3D18_14970 [Roseococcus sp.]|nr:hypothetical protein [Roseococcus sp.]